MKKFFLLLVAALPLVFASCGDDNDDPDPVDINLNLTQINLNYGTTNDELKCNIGGATWSSDDPFVATVDASGKVTAKHVGETKIKVSYDGYSASAKVIVSPTNTNFTMPILSWGASKTRIKSLVEEDKNMQEVVFSDPDLAATTLGYTTNGVLPGYTYSFVSDKLKAASMTVSEKQDADDDLAGYLVQYYKMYGEDSNTGALYLCNAENVDNATVILEYGLDMESENLDEYTVIWRENTNTKTRATGMPERSDFDAFRAAARAVAASCK